MLKTTLAPLALPSFPIENQKSDQTPALNLHSLTHRRCELPPRFPPSRLFGRLPPCLPSRLRLAGIRKPLTIPAVRVATIDRQADPLVDFLVDPTVGMKPAA